MLSALPFELATVRLGKLDAVAIDMIDGAEMHSIRADHFGMLFDLALIDHRITPSLGVRAVERISRRIAA